MLNEEIFQFDKSERMKQMHATEEAEYQITIETTAVIRPLRSFTANAWIGSQSIEIRTKSNHYSDSRRGRRVL